MVKAVGCGYARPCAALHLSQCCVACAACRAPDHVPRVAAGGKHAIARDLGRPCGHLPRQQPALRGHEGGLPRYSGPDAQPLMAPVAEAGSRAAEAVARPEVLEGQRGLVAARPVDRSGGLR